MTLAQLEALTWSLLNDNGTTHFYPNAVGALNEAQRWFALLTLSLEKTVTVNLPPKSAFQNLLAAVPDFVLPRRCVNSVGQQLRPMTLAQLDALDSYWQMSPGLPTRYVFRGLDLFGVYPQPPVADFVALTYICAPVPLVNQADVPMIRPQSQYALANYAAAVLRQPEGGQEWRKFAGFRDVEFMKEVGKVRDLVKARARDTDYEIEPFELERVKAR